MRDRTRWIIRGLLISTCATALLGCSTATRGDSRKSTSATTETAKNADAVAEFVRACRYMHRAEIGMGPCRNFM